ncbi:MAG: estB 4 [Acidobacteria bacterium]|nr:estB 4 [Acidobacteriota bacterium]
MPPERPSLPWRLSVNAPSPRLWPLPTRVAETCAQAQTLAVKAAAVAVTRLLLALTFSLAAAPAAPVPPTLEPRGTGALSSFLAEAVNRGDVPGVVVLVVTGDRVLYHEAFGTMNVAQGVDMRKDAIFRIASMTKPITSVAVMMLVEEGRLGLDDEVSRYLPAFRSPQVISRLDLAAGTWETRPAKRPITIRQLLTHTSGIGYSWSDPGLALIEKKTGHTSEAELPLVNEPGETWTYGASTKVLGDVVETLSGQRLDAFLAARIFGPLGMPDTGWSVPPDRRDRVVTLHQRTDGRLVETPNPPSLDARIRGDGRLFSTAADYGRFVRMILGDGRLGSARLLRPETVRQMGRNQTGDVKVRLQPAANADYTRPYPLGAGEDVWGFGFQLAAPARPEPARRRPGSMSWAGIDNTYFWIDRETGIGVVVLMQFLPFYDDAALAVLGGVESRVYQHLQPPAR